MSELKGACIFGQSGGPTSVINASAYGVIETALKNPNITRVLGAEHGIKGVPVSYTHLRPGGANFPAPMAARCRRRYS